MKKLFIILLTFILLLCFYACDEANINKESNNTSNGQESTEDTSSKTDDTESDSDAHPSVSTPTLDPFVPPTIDTPTLDPFVPPTIDTLECQHIFLISKINVIKPATCEETGEEIGTCLYCLKEITSTIPALGHETVIDMAISPTCTQEGKTEGSHCSRCNEVFVEQEVIPALGGEHVIVIDEAVESTCTQTGLTEGYHCSRCNKIFVAQNLISTKEHIKSDWIVDIEATCSEDGKKHLECENCDYREEDIIPASHKYVAVLKNDKKAFVCDFCDKALENVNEITIFLEWNENDSYTIELTGGYGKFQVSWTYVTPFPVTAFCETNESKVDIDLPYKTSDKVTITVIDELGQQSVYTFKLPTAELLSSEHTIVDVSAS